MTDGEQRGHFQRFGQALARSLPEHYGCRASFIGEDGEVMVLGHPGRRRAIAVANRHARKDLGLLNLADDRSALIFDLVVAEWWAVPGHRESCPLAAEFDRWCSDADATEADRPEIVEVGGEIKPHHTCPCREFEAGEWWLRWVPEGTPGAFAVTEVGW